MKILCVLPCQISERDKTGQMIGGGGLAGFNVARFPFRPNFKVFVAFRRMPNELETQAFDFQILNDKGETFIAKPRKFIRFDRDDIELKTLEFESIDNVEIPKQGIYQLSVSCDGDSVLWPLNLSTL